MKKSVRVFTLVIAAALCISFSGCNNSSTANKKEDSASEKVAEASFDLKGKTITIAVPDNSFIPQEDASVLSNNRSSKENSVMLDREKQAERKFNCNIEWKEMDKDTRNNLLEKVKTGDIKADIVYLERNSGIIDMILNKYILPLDEYIDYSSQAYNNPIQNNSLWKGQHYGVATFGSAKTLYNRLMSYNKTLIAEAGLPDPYELMQQGQWTWEEFLNICKKVTADTNGDGINDTWGMFTKNTNDVFYNFLYANNASYTKESDDGKIEFALESNEAIEALQFVSDIHNNYKIIQNTELTKADEDLFMSGKAAFKWNSPVTDVKKDKPFEIGYVCYPKGPSASDYISYANAGDFFAIPATAEDPKSIASVMSCLFSYFDSSQSEFLTDDDVYESSGMPENAIAVTKQIKEKIKYLWIDYDNTYRSLLRKIFDNILINNTPVNEAINTGKAEIINNLNTLNQAVQ